MGQTAGVIVICTPYPCVTNFGDTIPDCPTQTQYWAPAAPVVVIDEGAAARRALAQLDLDPVTIAMAPQPNLNEPNVLIGAPAYFWATGGAPAIGPLTSTVTQDGLTITLNATLDSVTYDTGDGTTLTCTRDQVASAPSSMSLQDDPDCGHCWTASGTYTLTATSAWTITWQGPTQNGAFDYALGSTIDVAVTDRPVNLTTEKTP
ncbi:putative ATP/GTP-binding protein [Serinibacter arcticus]|uniref:Putative ATP/GTP-binding protein n=1 Tax=Serinibacter arcticus TaxID=1655435 RepID=A0A4Z1E068_9MICO|nr:putative ATP/GTP-binding protein [Serinibacter arcticus]